MAAPSPATTADVSRSAPPSGHRAASSTVPALAVAVAYGAAMALYYPYRGVFAFDPDEGVNAILARLVDRGDALYTQIWYNQPPLLTELLRMWFAATAWQIDSGRMLVLGFGAACVFALYDSLRTIAGHGAAIVGCLLLVTSAYFPRLSVSLMQAVPSLALAVLALWALIRSQCGQRWTWIALAGVLMACALVCKLTSALLVPGFAVSVVAWAPRETSAESPWRPVASWLLCTAAMTALLLAVLVGPAQLTGLVDTHLAARQNERVTRYGWGGLVLTSFAEWPLTLLGVGGYALVLYWRLRRAIVFPVWAAVAAAGILNHAPIWYHHQLLLSLPHCAAGGIAVAELFRRDHGAARLSARTLSALRMAAIVLVIALPLWSAFGARLPAPTLLAGAPRRMLDAMRAGAATTQLVVTNDPMYAFRAGYAVPPKIAALPLLRVVTDRTLAADIDAAFARQPPEQVLLTPLAVPELVGYISEAMGDRYRLVLTVAGIRLYARTY